ncbi:hypothetical protein FDZ74_09360, partial [bacterium]
MEARRWCLIAIRENPNLEEPWLILAAISSPQASVGYLQQALKINPNSERAMAGMKWALNRLASVPSRDHLAAGNKPQSDTQPIKIATAVSVGAEMPGAAQPKDKAEGADSIVDQFRDTHSVPAAPA